jgi:glycosyltransferase involved in cell wall biosynthesis
MDNSKVDASIVIPVNAQGDISNAVRLLKDIQQYDGSYAFEVICVLNNYTEYPAGAVERMERESARVVTVPDVRQFGKAPAICARAIGMRYAQSDVIISFDADCRIPDVNALLNWYVHRFEEGYVAAYTHVDYYGTDNASVIKARIFAHHTSRWVKRNILNIPTTRGSNYAVRRDLFLRLWDMGYIADELHVGLTMDKVGEVAYSNFKAHVVLTSGRVFNKEKSWLHLAWYLIYRLRYNLKALRIKPDIADSAPYTGDARTYEDEP